MVIAVLPSGVPALGIVVFACAGFGCSALLPLTISFGQEQLTVTGASVAGGVIAFYQLGYGIAAFGTRPLVDAGVGLPTLFGFAAVAAVITGGLSFILDRRTPRSHRCSAAPPGRTASVTGTDPSTSWAASRMPAPRHASAYGARSAFTTIGGMLQAPSRRTMGIRRHGLRRWRKAQGASMSTTEAEARPIRSLIPAVWTGCAGRRSTPGWSAACEQARVTTLMIKGRAQVVP